MCSIDNQFDLMKIKKKMSRKKDPRNKCRVHVIIFVKDVFGYFKKMAHMFRIFINIKKK